MDLILSAVILQAGEKSPGSPLGPFIPIVAIFAIFYFLLIRPQQKRQKDQQAMLKAIVKGGERVRVKVARNRVESVAKKKGDDS